MSERTILVADDDASIRMVLSQALTRADYEVFPMSNLSTMWNHIARGDGDLLITDVMMPDGSAFDILPRIKKARPDLPIIVMSAQNTFMTAVRASEAGAFEYLPKPFDLSELTATVAKALAERDSQKKKDLAEAAPKDEEMPLVGRSGPMQEVYRTMARLIQTDLTVMISGESGTGKEVVARALHDFGKRKGGPFNAINMAAIPQDLIESELFGHEKGAFTGAHGRSIGHFERAAGGTLFLDEIGDMPMAAQTRLLRVLQEGEFTRVGGRDTIETDVRIVAATHRDLQQMIRQGLFREDLFYRLNVVQLHMPALRERRDDVADLAQHFAQKFASDGEPVKAFEKEALDVLRQHDWPGNVRELENLVQRFVALYPDEVISAETVRQELSVGEIAPQTNASSQQSDDLAGMVERYLLAQFAQAQPDLPRNGLYQRVIDEIEVPLLEITLNNCNGNQIRASELLGLNRNTLRKKLQAHDIQIHKHGNGR